MSAHLNMTYKDIPSPELLFKHSSYTSPIHLHASGSLSVIVFYSFQTIWVV